MESDRLMAGERLLNLGRFEEALDCFVQDEADNLKALFGSAVARQMLGRFEEAELRYERVLDADPRHAEALANLIAMSVERFDLRRVERYSRWLLDLNGHSAAALQGLVLVAVERRDYAAASQYFRRIVPGAAAADDAIEYRLSSQTVERLRSYDGAFANPH